MQSGPSNYRQFKPTADPIAMTEMLFTAMTKNNADMAQNAIQNGAYFTGEAIAFHMFSNDLFATYDALKTLTPDWPPLIWATKQGHIKVVQALLDRKDDIDQYDDDEEGPLQLASARGDIRMVELLIQYKASLNGENAHFGIAPINLAAIGGHNDVLKALIKAGAEIDHPEDCSEYTALHYAARGNHDQCIITLLDAGANIEAEDTRGFNPLQNAVEATLEEGGDERLKGINTIYTLATHGTTVNRYQHPETNEWRYGMDDGLWAEVAYHIESIQDPANALTRRLDGLLIENLPDLDIEQVTQHQNAWVALAIQNGPKEENSQEDLEQNNNNNVKDQDNNTNDFKFGM